VAQGFHLLGLGFTAAIKATWAVGFLFGGWGMFVLLRRWFGRSAGAPRVLGGAVALVGGLIYVYAPYHLLTIYVRAALAEFFAMAWFPWVLLAFSDLVDSTGDGNRSLRSIALAALALAGLVMTHTGMILVFTPLLAAYLVFALVRRGYRLARPRLREGDPRASGKQSASSDQAWWRDLGGAILRLVAAGALAGGLAAIFLLPALAEQRFVSQESWLGNTYSYQRHFVFPNQFLDTFWGYGYSDDPTGPNDGMSFQLGVIGVGLALTAVAAGLRRRASQRSTTAFFLAALLTTLFAMTPFARPLWDAIGLLAVLQFPWRLLSIASFCLAIVSGAAIASLIPAGGLANSEATAHGSTHPQIPAAVIVALVVVLASFPFTLPQFTDITPVDESTQAIIRFETKFPDMIGFMAATEQPFTESPLTAQYLAGEPLQKAALLSGSGRVRTVRVTSASVVAQATLDSPATLVFYTYDFPGWQATVDGLSVPHRTQPPYGLISLDVPAGDHTVAIRHGTTPVRTAGAIISSASLLIVISLLIFGFRQPGRSASLPVAQSTD